MGWQFSTTTFDVAADSAIFEEWFPTRAEYTADAVLGGSVAYVDIGATIEEPMSIVAQTTSTGDRTALLALVGTSATLQDDAGRTATATLVQATPVRVKTPTSGIYRLSMTFVRSTT